VAYRSTPDYKYRIIWYLLAVLLLLGIVFGSLWHDPPKIIFSFKFADKLMHITAYLLLMLWYVQLIYSFLARLLLAIAFIALGVSLEYFQALGGVRFFDWYDATANGIGVLIALSLGFTRAENLILWFENKFLLKNRM